MAWSGAFTASLDAPSKTTEWALRFIGHSNDYFLGAGRTVRMRGLIEIGEADVDIDAARVTPGRWSVNFGGWTMVINGDLRPVSVSAFRKGAIAELYMRRDGSNHERVAIGQLRSLSGGRGVWRLEFGDFVSAMTTRMSTLQGEMSFFHNAGITTEVTSGHAFSFGASPANRLYLDDVAVFEKDSNYDGLAYVTDNSGNTSYYRWSTKTTLTPPAGYLVVTSTGAWPATASLNALAVGDKVKSIARLQGRPDHVFSRVMMSTGSATQGQFDDYPKSWGMGLAWHPDMVDAADMGYWYSVWGTATGTYEVQLLFDDPSPSAIRSLIDSFLTVGMWPVFRQGRISWRVVQDPDDALAFTIAARIRDTDIISIESHDMYSPSQSVVYAKSGVLSSDSSGVTSTISFIVSNVKALPANDEIIRDASQIYRIDTPAQSVKAAADAARLRAWDLYTWEKLVLIVHERFAGLVAGDIVTVTSSFIYGWSEAAGQTYRQRRGMILGNRWQPGRSRCILTIGVIGK